MKFGLEAEKFIFDHKSLKPSESVFSILDAVSDFAPSIYHYMGDKKTTNEFVLNMLEFGTTPSDRPLEVLKDYLFNYLMIKTVAAREQVSMVPMASLPMDYLPHMTPKRAYYVQNSILSGRRQADWAMDTNSPLKAAGNCAGIHVHIEIETPYHYLFSNDELKNKFNMGMMLTPMIAFASSPYFYSRHEGKSMRGIKYYQEVYKRFPLNGQLPPVMESSIDALNFTRRSGDHWVNEGMKLGFEREELESLVSQKTANWNPLRWNARWNTIELRFLDSNSIDIDAARFIWICSAMRRMDLKGENLSCRTLSAKKLDLALINDSLQVSGKEVSILPDFAIRDLFERAMIFGTRDDLVEAYLYRLAGFAESGLGAGERWLFNNQLDVLKQQMTTSDWILSETNGKSVLTEKEAIEIVMSLISYEEERIQQLKFYAPDIFQLLADSSGRDLHV